MLLKSRKNRRTNPRTLALKTYAKSLGFTDCKICDAKTLKSHDKNYQNWIEKNFHGEMDYLKTHSPLKTHPKKLLPKAKSIIFVTLNYYQERKPTQKNGQVARYARGRDYHKVFRTKLKKLETYLKRIDPTTQTKFFADSGPLLERQYAEQAGIGFIGKNCNVITLNSGSWILLGEIITSTHLNPDDPADESHGVCGTCTRCIDICPTGALQSDYSIDARKCISYLTIENKGPIPEELRPQIKDWIFGCDLCQEVCPHNFRAKQTTEPDFIKPIAGDELDLKEILEIKTDQEFTQKFQGSPLMRAKRIGLIRNACVVAANQNRTDLIPLLKQLTKSETELIKEHANWAVSQLTSP